VDHPMSLDLTSTVAVITGAAGGLGSAVAEKFAASGATLVLLDVSAEALDPLCQRIVASGAPEPVALGCDVADFDQVEEVAQQVSETVGPCRVLVNNAGVYKRAPLEEHSIELWDHTIAVNLRGYFLCTRAFGRAMLKARDGSIVNVSSIAAQGPTPGAVSYCVSKAAVVALTRQTALEWGARGVRASAVSPGFVSTPMSSTFGKAELVRKREQLVPLRQIATSEEVARVIGFLASEESSYVSGTNLTVDGGVTQTLSQTFPRD
jgi:NAD(P)-dependent dehydrogenase (short-subunit alcohol dehydrogenase family)